MIERDAGHAEEARSRFGEALSLQRELSNWACASVSLSALGELAVREREPTRASALFAESLALQRKVGIWYRMVDCLWGLAAAAFGLGGRARRAADASERIRKAVSNRIRDSLARIARKHPLLGRHLSNAISTGTFCSYNPERPLDWEL